ncbi:MAG: DNA (cytosine-5-)-methyltransferase [Gammaproteobacteria bacterium]|nr:DNA (cytosine-5-)-methyltransferase [Gammaproteobacteria bacterium]
MKNPKPFNWQRPPQLRLSLDDELIVDNFAGGGGASMGIEQALGRSVDIAINHDPEAIAMHEANHPHTKHLISDVFEVDPVEVCQGRPVGLAWFSPDCKHFSKAKGGKPVSKKIRSLAWVAVKWAKLKKPRVMFLENVEEFQTWGPLTEDNKPCPVNKGLTFRRFVSELEKLGYQVEWKELKACDYGAPTIRNRLFLIARCDGQPIVWPAPTHGTKKGLLPYNTAADCINWTLPCHSIFLTKEQAKEQKLNIKRPLAENTLRRIAKGMQRYVIDADNPFIVPAFITEHANGSNQRNMPIDEPLRTICAQVKGGHFALVTAFLAKHYTGVIGSHANKPIGTVTAIDHHSLVTSHLLQLKSGQHGQDNREPMPTLTAGASHVGEVRAFLVKYYGADQDPRLNEPMHTVTSRDRFGIVTVAGQDYKIADIGMRMLAPRELYRAQGFPDQYIIDPVFNGKPLSKKAQVRMCGNSVSPVLSKALIEANYNQIEQPLRAAQ